MDSPAPRAWRRVLRLWGIYGKIDLLWTLRDWQSIVALMLSDTLSSVATVIGTLLLAARFGGIGHWHAGQITFMLGYSLLATGLPSLLFNYNVAYISRRIGRGQLDHMLIQPQPLWMGLLTDGFSPVAAIMEIGPGSFLFFFSMHQGARLEAGGWPVLLVLNLLASVVIGLAFSFIWGALAFWAPSAAEEVNSTSWRALGTLQSFPLDGVHATLTVGLLTVLPSGFLAWYPCRALLGLDSAWYAGLITPAAAIGFAVLAVVIFRKGLEHYGRTGSQRYLALGHRR